MYPALTQIYAHMSAMKNEQIQEC